MASKRRWSFVLICGLLVVLVSGPGWAQAVDAGATPASSSAAPSPRNGGDTKIPSSQPAFDDAEVESDPVQRLLLQGIPEDTDGVADAIKAFEAKTANLRQRNDAFEEQITQVKGDIERGNRRLARIESEFDRLTSSGQNIDKFDCQKGKTIDDLRSEYATFLRVNALLQRQTENFDSMSEFGLRIQGPDSAEACGNIKEAAKQSLTTAEQAVEDYKTNLSVTKTSLANHRKRQSQQMLLESRLDALKKKAAELKTVADRNARETDVIGKLPWMIIFIGLFSLSIMIMIRRFPPDVQRQWVESGQVIQFMTVTTILIVILALGLGKSLNGESLGTVLGSIGGYVLAQGIGRAATAQARRKDEPISGAPPQPAPPPNTAPAGGGGGAS